MNCISGPSLATIPIVAALAIILGTPGVSRASDSDNYQYCARKISSSKPAYDFTLVGPDGKAFSLHALLGKIVLIDFGFTNCPNVCPTTLANLAAAYDRLSAAEQERIRVLFITLDPDRDTPAVLKDYVPFYEKHFIGLTGKPDQITAIANAYGVAYENEADRKSESGGYNIAHSTAVYLVAPTGRCIALYGESELRDSQRMAEDLRHFLALFSTGSDNWQSEKLGAAKPLTASARQLYIAQCASCHRENGRGIAGKYPSLVGSAWVTGAPNRLTAMVLDGVKGKGDADGAQFGGVMPAWRAILPPAYTAQILTYIRQAWGNAAPAISDAYVEKLSSQLGPRADFRSWKELEALLPDTSANLDDAEVKPAKTE